MRAVGTSEPSRHGTSRAIEEGKERMKTKLYLDVDGVVLRRTGQLTARGTTEFEIANGAATFLRWCADHFDCIWLTARSRDGDTSEVERAFRHAVREKNSSEQEKADLMAYVSRIPVASWGATKAGGITVGEDFFWVDDDPDVSSLNWLEHHGLRSRLIAASTDQRHDDLSRVQVILADRRRAQSVAATKRP